MQIIFYGIRARAICPMGEREPGQVNPKGRRGRRVPVILYLIAVSRAPVLSPGMVLVKSHQNGVKTIYILPYGDGLFSWVLLG